MLKNYHPTINFTVEYSLDKVNFSNVEVRRCGHKLLTDFYIKPTDTDQYLEFSSCRVYHSEKSISYNQAHRSNRICSGNKFSIIDVINLSVGLKTKVTTKKLLENKF